ncbi:MAG TPA: PQQ-binding-like beta-propeller repeat protein [Terriglobia bacterium]|nr:PQQ-binding-like beta-propeller repeat protein [Terriglobia bacterium]
MKRRGYILSVATIAWIGIMSWVVTVHPQAGGAPVPPSPGQQPPAAPPPAPGGGGGGRGGVPGTESGWATFQTRCSICHSNPGPNQGPTAEAIRLMTPEKIVEALSSGKMKTQAEGLNEMQIRRVAEFMSGRPVGSSGVGAASLMPNKCANNPTINNLNAGWIGWGFDNANTRFQPARGAGLTAAQVPNLKLKWAFGFPKGETSSSQPTVAGGRVFVGSDNGFIYSLDAATGCVYWSFENGSIVRGAVTVGPISGQGNARFAVFFGDGHANIFAVNAQDGRLLWKVKVDDHVVARITAGSKYYDGKVIVPVSSSEEFASGNPGYPCCTSRGSVVALDANTGKQLWKAWVVTGDPKPVKTMANGVTIYAPGGGGVWNTPTIDPVRNAVYFGTGDATTAPAPKTTDGIMAVDLKTGDLLWAFQADENDVFMGGCGGPVRSDACPTPNGPDLDIGNPPILKTLPNGKRVLIAGTKRGHVFALDPDNKGALLYRVLATTGAPPPPAPAGGGRGGGGGSIVWGGTADDQNVYYAAGRGANLVALRLGTGERVWGFTPPQGGGDLGAAPTAIPGVVFQGSSNGRLYAVSTADGKSIWDFNTAQEFQTVNGVTARGGAITSTGATIANGRVFITSGYAISSGNSGGNVLLSFGID